MRASPQDPFMQAYTHTLGRWWTWLRAQPRPSGQAPARLSQAIEIAEQLVQPVPGAAGILPESVQLRYAGSEILACPPGLVKEAGHNWLKTPTDRWPQREEVLFLSPLSALSRPHAKMYSEDR